jgi:hypothetical protein
MLPSVPEWKYKKITLAGHATKEPILLFYRDALDCVEYLFKNPIFTNKIDFSPVRLYRDIEQTIRVYTEWITGNAAWEMQVGLQLCLCYMHVVSLFVRKCSQMVRLSLVLSSHPTKPTFP